MTVVERAGRNLGSVDLADFRRVVEASIDRDQYRWAVDWVGAIPIYDGAGLGERFYDEPVPADLLDELARVFGPGPGVAMFAGALDPGVVDRASAVFAEIIAEQRAAGGSAGDHFAEAGANDRIWNSLEKLALADPATHVAYFDNVVVEAASLAWLGPDYQVTTQVNVVNPGGAAQAPHRDYHLGFMGVDQARSYPAHVHRLSPALTLQGAIAHVDMPIASGPTMMLAHSHKYELGYIAWQRDDFREYFADNHSQPALTKGDAVFFNPAVFHGAGFNRTPDVVRMANLLQVGSAFGRSIETVDREAIVAAVYPHLQAARSGGRSDVGLGRVIAASAEGYPFPCDLDRDQPVDGMAPPSMADRLWARLVAESPALS